MPRALETQLPVVPVACNVDLDVCPIAGREISATQPPVETGGPSTVTANTYNRCRGPADIHDRRQRKCGNIFVRQRGAGNIRHAAPGGNRRAVHRHLVNRLKRFARQSRNSACCRIPPPPITRIWRWHGGRHGLEVQFLDVWGAHAVGVRTEFADVAAETAVKIHTHTPNIVGGCLVGGQRGYSSVRYRHSPKDGRG